ncbi:PREDICTED: uncharacterized protein LOC105558311 isoform X2 [Vollenhovia emeryi]|uniref:uncharacterized protein LOC105558311 isoform X2 n=1 Tax=Vollenhovia emeryi TaxID=411798 RepID=UPI0005F4675E|nr:PREDICTED: uncharacterized protein LOC105558311 isoform X2 [Vollenhovia emeryi]
MSNASNLQNLLQVLSFVVPCLVVTLKYTTFCIKAQDIKQLTELTKYHWELIQCKEELKILKRYYTIGKWMTFVVVVGLIFSVCLFLFVQLLPKLLDAVIPLNESRPLKLLGLATLLFDQDEHFVLIFVHMAVALSVEATTIAATETMGLVYLQHMNGLFRITSLRLKHAFDCKMQISISKKHQIYYTNIINAIIIHNRALEFFYCFNSCFETSYFLLLVFGTSSLSINLFRLVQAGFKKEFEEQFVVGVLVAIHFIYIFLNNLLAQVATNHSADIFYKTCELPWYSVPIPLQKLLQFIIQRSVKSCKFTLHTVFVASLEFFATVVSCSLSYFTVFLSLQY